MKRLTALIISLFLIGAALISVAADMGPIVKSSAAEVSGELPVINISTDSGVSVTEKVYEGASMSVQLTDKYAEYTSPYTEKEGDLHPTRACVGKSHSSRKIVSHFVTHMGNVIVIGKEHPMLALADAQHICLAVKLDFVGILSRVAKAVGLCFVGGVTSAPYQYSVPLFLGIGACIFRILVGKLYRH